MGSNGPGAGQDEGTRLRQRSSATAPPPSTARCGHPQWSPASPVWLTGDPGLHCARGNPEADDRLPLTTPTGTPSCGPCSQRPRPRDARRRCAGASPQPRAANVSCDDSAYRSGIPIGESQTVEAMPTPHEVFTEETSWADAQAHSRRERPVVGLGVRWSKR
jgi:hypothetical protein